MPRRAAVRSLDVVCFSHLRWGFIFDRPHHLMMRFARTRRVFFIEDPVFGAPASHAVVKSIEGVHVVVPHLPAGIDAERARLEQRRLVGAVLQGYEVHAPLVWFYTPLALPLIDDLETSGIVFDCMHDVATRDMTASETIELESELLSRSHVVFVGGFSLYDIKHQLHHAVHLCPSSVDVHHFADARQSARTPPDLGRIPRPRVGFAGVIDDRIDLALINDLATRQPAWQFVMLGPVSGIDPQSLPRPANIHYLRMKSYEDLPAYLRGWDVALIPFVSDDATRTLNPIQTLEYLAAGLPVVSTPIRDVAEVFGRNGLVQIAGSPAEFHDAIAAALQPGGRAAVERAQTVLSTTSWDRVFGAMCRILERSEITWLPAWQTSALSGRPVVLKAVPPPEDGATLGRSSGRRSDAMLSANPAEARERSRRAKADGAPGRSRTCDPRLRRHLVGETARNGRNPRHFATQIGYFRRLFSRDPQLGRAASFRRKYADSRALTENTDNRSALAAPL